MPNLNIVSGIIEKVVDRIDDFTFDKQEKADLIQEINKAQLEVNKVEAGRSSLFVSGWRPSVGWVCSFALAYHFVLQPLLMFVFSAFGNPMDLPQFDMNTLTTILLGMLGMSGMRSFDKAKKST